MAIISSKNARVRIDSTNFAATKWSVDVKADEIDITNFETGGFKDYLTSYVEAMISIDLFYDTTNGPFDTNLLSVGSQPAILLFTQRDTAQEFFSFPASIILSANVSAEVRDAVRVSVTARNKGAFLYPGNAVAFTGIS